MKTSKKLNAYVQAVADYEFAVDTVNSMEEKFKEIGSIVIGSTITVDRKSSDKQFIYAMGLLTSQVNACQELGIPSGEYLELRESVSTLYQLIKEYKPWEEYAREIQLYKREVYAMLNDDELFTLLEYPAKP